jgi:hypothetical protein
MLLTCFMTAETEQDTSYFTANGIDYSRRQLPIQNAFALTIHKVQGLSMSMITVSLDMIYLAMAGIYSNKPGTETRECAYRKPGLVCIQGRSYEA